MNRTTLILAAVVIALASGTLGSLVTRKLAPAKHPAPISVSTLPDQSLTPTARIVELPGPVERAAMADMEGQIAELRAELGLRLDHIRELEQTLAQQDSPTTPDPATTNAQVRTERTSRREGFAERWERMKVEEPERYAEIQKSRDEFRQRMERTTAERAAFLLDVNTENMNEEQLASHSQLTSLIEESWRLQQQLRSGEIEGSTREVRHQLMDNMRQMSGLYQQERQYLLAQTGRELGYEGAEAEAFSSHIQSILDMTSMNPFAGHHRGPSGRGGGGGESGGRSER